jgi:hypothetical protein
VGLRDKLRRLERAAEGEMVTLLCRECGEELTVAEDTDLAYLAWEWAQETGEKSYQPTPPEVFVVVEHEQHGEAPLVVKATGKPWPLWTSEGVGLGLRGRLRRIEREARAEMIEVLQPDGTVRRFPASDCADALLALTSGRDHPLAEAVRNSPDPDWQKTFYNMLPLNRYEIADLSEP